MGSDAKETILDEAIRLVFGPRERAYAHPKEDFARTVGMINALLGHKLRAPLKPEDFAMIMICCKLSRLAHAIKRDSIVDVAGYAETLARVVGVDE